MGTSNNCITSLLHFKDHPHACGDKYEMSLLRRSGDGSSPRVWGQDKTITQFSQRHGIIPTRVGTRVFTNANLLASEDHPHACGDKLSAQRPSLRSQGSSPRVWGQAILFRLILHRAGIIPTRVGTSSAEMSGRKRV